MFDLEARVSFLALIFGCEILSFRGEAMRSFMATSNYSQYLQRYLLVGCLMFMGCRESDSRGLTKSPVLGTVSYGKPFPQGEVIFKHPSGEITVAKFEANGQYKAHVPEGVNKVMVRSQTSSFAEQGRPGGQQEVFTDHIPKRYRDFATSKMEYTVQDGENTFDIKLID